MVPGASPTEALTIAVSALHWCLGIVPSSQMLCRINVHLSDGLPGLINLSPLWKMHDVTVKLRPSRRAPTLLSPSRSIVPSTSFYPAEDRRASLSWVVSRRAISRCEVYLIRVLDPLFLNECEDDEQIKGLNGPLVSTSGHRVRSPTADWAKASIS